VGSNTDLGMDEGKVCRSALKKQLNSEGEDITPCLKLGTGHEKQVKAGKGGEGKSVEDWEKGP